MDAKTKLKNAGYSEEFLETLTAQQLEDLEAEVWRQAEKETAKKLGVSWKDYEANR